MKNILNIPICRALVAGVLAAGFAASCDDAELGPLDNAAYIKEAQKEMSKIVTVEDKGSTASLTVRLGGKSSAETSFRLVSDPEVLERFNTLNGTSYSLLPADMYDLPAEPAVIPAGEVAAAPSQIAIHAFTGEMDDSGQTYAIPVALRPVAGDMPVLGNASNFLLVCERKMIVPVPLLNQNTYKYPNRIMLNMKDAPITFDAYTFEVKVRRESFTMRNFMIVGFDNGEGSINNRMWLRFERSTSTSDTQNRWLQLNSQVQPAATSVLPCEAKTWHHVAVVFDGSNTELYLDGELAAQKSMPRTTITFKHFALQPQPGSSRAPISFSEARLWNVARTQTQIKNNMNRVNPQSEGLLGYWHMNEGSGYTFEDATGNGNTGQCEYSHAGDLWDPQTYGPATGLEWAADMNNM